MFGEKNEVRVRKPRKKAVKKSNVKSAEQETKQQEINRLKNNRYDYFVTAHSCAFQNGVAPERFTF